jgi:DNA-binding GntR family transcriptional regulator
MSAFEAVPHTPLAVLAADAVRGAILDGRLKPGVKIVEVQIAAELGFSRAPLREALRLLVEEGLVVRVPYRGSFVAEVSAKTVEEIASLRRQLEPFAAELAIPQLRTTTGRRLLRGALKSMTAAQAKGDVGRCIEAYMLLHRSIYELSGHSLLLASWRTWESKLRLHFALDPSASTSMFAAIEDHERLVRLLLDGDLTEIHSEFDRRFRPTPSHDGTGGKT